MVSNETLSIHRTLIVRMFFIGGLIIRADRLGTVNQGKTYADQDKLRILDNRLVLGVTGYGQCGGPAGVVAYTPIEIISEYIEKMVSNLHQNSFPRYLWN